MVAPVHVRNFLDHLQGLKKNGPNQWSAKCPAHADSSPSLSVAIGDNGAVVFNDKAGCDNDAILRAMGLEWKDTFPPKPRQETSTSIEYPYYDEDGELLFQVVKKTKEDGTKAFLQRKPDGIGGWSYTTTGLRKPLYRLPMVLQAIADGKTIYVVEGEKDVETLLKRGFEATTSPGGAGKWLAEHTKTLKGANVVVCVDRDTPGYKHGLDIVESLEGVANSIKVIQPPEPHNDASDAYDAGLSMVDFEEVNLIEALDEHDPFGQLMVKLREIQRSNHLSYKQKVGRAKQAIKASTTEEAPDTFGRLIQWKHFLAEPDAYDWLIPGLIERGDRIIVVGGEGAGKSFLLRQMALSISAGIHPFNRSKIEPKRTLFVDLENPERIIRRTSKIIFNGIREIYPYASIEDNILIKPNGLNLLDPKDEAELERIIDASNPDILVISPIYKAYNATESSDRNAQVAEIVKYLDYLRDTFGVALMLEHHAPLGSNSSGRILRPVDSGVWTRWPEFGLAISPDELNPGIFDLKHFRGGREEREWPQKIMRGEFPHT